MDSLESVRNLLQEYLQVASTHTRETENWIWIIPKNDFRDRIYKAFFNLIANPTHSPENIIHVLATYTNGLDGFSTNKCIQAMVAFACTDALARRKPEVLTGSWEKLVWIIVKYFSLYNYPVGKGITTFIGHALHCFAVTNRVTLDWIIQFASHDLCPNPCLRIELFKIMNIFNCKLFEYDRKSFRKMVINTIIELSDNTTSLTVNTVLDFCPMDLQLVMEENFISMAHIMNDYDLNLKKSEIIAALFKLTRNFAILVKEKHQRLDTHPIIPELNLHESLKKQLLACFTFCGLTPEIKYDYYNHDDNMLYLLQVVGKDSLLLNYMSETLDTITQVSLSFPDEDGFRERIIQIKDNLIHSFLKEHIIQFPKHQNSYEIHGGTLPGAIYHLRYFQNNSIDQYYDCDYDSECDESDENYNDIDDYEENNSEENDSETDVPDEERSAGVAYRNDFLHEDFS